MSNILYVTTPKKPYVRFPDDIKITSDYIDIFTPEHSLYILSRKTKDQSKNKKVKFYGFTDKEGMNSYLRSVINLFTFPEKDKIDVVFSSNREWYYGIWVVIFSKIYKKKSVVTFAGNVFNSYKYKPSLWNKVLSYLINVVIALRVLKCADHIITLSDEVKSNLTSIGYKKEKISVIRPPWAQKPKNFKPSCKKLNLKEKKKNVLFVGSLVRRKGVDSVLNILENKDVRKKYHFFFAGPDVEGYRAKLNKYGNVTVLGKIGRDELFNYYSCVDLLLFPSFSEGFGRVNAEAISVGCPVIARNIVNLDRIVDKVFESDEELLDILLQEKFRKRKKKIKLPDEIKPETIKKQHLEVIEEVQRED